MNPIKVNCSTLILLKKEVERVGLNFQIIASKNKCSADFLSTIGSEKFLITDDFLVDINYLKSLNPKEWKDQDHYAVLGLGHLRFHANDEDIRRAYRKMVLQHHPDKRKAKGEEVKQDDDYFTCITKAYEILGSPKSRRAYDSVDPQFDDSLPTQMEIETHLYTSFNKFFDLNARWSERKNVPSFGDENSERTYVDNFYSFWYDFESWREFSYLDEEDKEKGQDRDERRWIEKQNKAARIKRKKEEMLRIRALVDLAYNNDKRILRFKNEEKERKLALKRAKMDAAQAQKEEQERKLKEAQLAKERAEKVEQKRIEQIRSEKEQQKKAIRKERKLFRDKAKECKYFSSNENEMLKNMEGVEKICEVLNLSELQAFNRKLEKSGKEYFISTLKYIEKKLQNDKQEFNQLTKANDKSDKEDTNKEDYWNNENVQLLIKSVNLFPAGTAQRWEVIATFINQHSCSDNVFLSRDVINKAKSLQNANFSKNNLKTQANVEAFSSFEKNKRDIQSCPDTSSTRDDFDTSSINGLNGNKIIPLKNFDNKISTENFENNTSLKTPTPTKIWSKEEQALLEQAIKSYPLTTPDRWERIAECLPNRSKKDCLRRVKELVELVNSKKDAQQAFKHK